MTSKSEDENNIEDGQDDCNIDDDEKMSPSFIDPNMSGLPLTQQSFTIIDVCGDKRLFKTFIMEWRTKHSYAVSLASLGLTSGKVEGGDACGIPLEEEVSWDNRDAYYISLSHQQLQQARHHHDGPVPGVACWLLDPGGREKNLHRMVTNFLPTEVHMIHGIGGGIGLGSLGMSPQNPGSGRYRATTEAVLVRHLVQYFNACLDREGLLSAFRDVEMPAAVTLCRMELNGFGFSEKKSERQKCVMLSKLSALEEQAYTIAGHPFSLSAPDDVSQLRLPPNETPGSPWQEGRGWGLQDPAAQATPPAWCDLGLHSATGRNVPKDFDIQLPDLIGERSDRIKDNT
ncbi:hypothetical protein DPMN_046249 [Dreissena polymorpha]|uniref:Uncharacterized protein n=1 Tax=Dreissena polymorpha TaxID=45954 RepID=A0A9D4D7I2_DREPO|nr:hypothetical protein DPMN_046249 [Dreissena polymorpha]